MIRANYIGAPAYFELNQACRVLTDAFGICTYLVGSSLERRDFRDVDLRAILEDTVFDRLFPCAGAPELDPFWSLACSAISLFLSKHSGLPIDFQFQRETQANAAFPNERRHAIGIFHERPPAPESEEP